MCAIRLGTNEMVRWGMTAADMVAVADAIVRAVRGEDPGAIAEDVDRFRRAFDRVHFCH